MQRFLLWVSATSLLLFQLGQCLDWPTTIGCPENPVPSCSSASLQGQCRHTSSVCVPQEDRLNGLNYGLSEQSPNVATCFCPSEHGGRYCELHLGDSSLPPEDYPFPDYELGNGLYGYHPLLSLPPDSSPQRQQDDGAFFSLPGLRADMVYAIDFAILIREDLEIPNLPPTFVVSALYQNGQLTGETFNVSANLGTYWPASLQAAQFACQGKGNDLWMDSFACPILRLPDSNCAGSWRFILRFRSFPRNEMYRCSHPDAIQMRPGGDCFWVGGQSLITPEHEELNKDNLTRTWNISRSDALAMKESCTGQGGDLSHRLGEQYGTKHLLFLSEEFRKLRYITDPKAALVFAPIESDDWESGGPSLRMPYSQFFSEIPDTVIGHGRPESQPIRMYSLCIGPPHPKDYTPAAKNFCPAICFPEIALEFCFPRMPAGAAVSIRCPMDSIGDSSPQAYMICGPSGEWLNEYPDLQECGLLHQQLYDYLYLLNLGTVPVPEILENVTSLISNEVVLSKDLLIIIQISERAVEVEGQQLAGLDDDDLDDASIRYFTAQVNLSDKKLIQDVAWKGLIPAVRRDALSRSQVVLERAGLLSAENADTTVDTDTIQATISEADPSSNVVFEFEESVLTIPKEFIQFEQPSTLVGFRRLHRIFNTLGSSFDDPSLVNSMVVGATLNSTKSSLPNADPSTWPSIKFKHLNPEDVPSDQSQIQCVFWDTDLDYWSTEGCELWKVTSTHAFCRCNHLTNFAVLMDASGRLKDSVILSWITVPSCTLSIFFLILTSIVLWSLLKNVSPQSTQHGPNEKQRIFNHLLMIGHLILGQLFLLATLDMTSVPWFCGLVAGLMHFFFLTALLCMTAESSRVFIVIFLYLKFNRWTGLPEWYTPKSLFLTVHSVSILIVVLTAAIGQGHAYGTPDYCWLNAGTGAIWAFMAPVALVVIGNSIVALLTIREIQRYEKNLKEQMPSDSSTGTDDKTSRTKTKKMVKVIGTFIVVFGITWGFGFLMLLDVRGSSLTALGIIFILLNGCQGVFIFIFDVYFDRDSRKLIAKWLSRCTKTT